ncbi:nucleosome assembly protein 1-like 1-B [Limulus polyphemus]|uniref:Nucleosome assembly protein 1-like 1-B n=1 Tax=Limulus polyphemus TaxID=6850 RepID=A0ABM1BNH5_LIMPO|nr:nucleosome assembly protein 1-like 1-B [Limulus polyphemus]
MADPEKGIDTAEGVEEVEEMEDEGKTSMSLLTAEMMKNPQVLAALQSRLGSMIGSPSGYIESLPKSVKRRIKALKNLQLECTRLEAKFYEEVHALECKYADLYMPFFEKRNEIINGKVEPTDGECDFPSDSEKDDDEITNELKKKTKVESKENKDNENKEQNETQNDDTKGIPEFWLTTFKNVEMISERIQEHDEPILKDLTDVKVKLLDSNPMGFTLEFHFKPNEYFSNTLLTKDYEMRCVPDEDDPFGFEGPEIFKCKGCTIDWKKGKNVTMKTIKKKQKHKSRGSVRTVTKTVQNDSFFNFFSPPTVPSDEEQLDEDTQVLLAADFEMGHFIRERIVPKAVLYFTGEALQDGDFDEEEEGEEEEAEDEEKDDDEDEDNDPDYNPQSDKTAKKQPPPECKQQ